MTAPVLFDNNTLSNFAVVRRLDLLEARYGYRTPHWTREVRDEAGRGVDAGYAFMADVTSAAWLGEPLEPPTKLAKRKDLVNIQVGLNDGVRPAEKHLGEAESMFWANELGGVFVTDDGPATRFARVRFPGLRVVVDTVDVLRDCHENAEAGCPEAFEVLTAMLDAGRHIRPGRQVPHELVCPPPTGARR